MLICTDLDGTLLNAQHQISPATAAAIQRARVNGHAVVIVSSRPPRSVQAIAQALNLGDTPQISLGGGFMFAGKSVLSRSQIPAEMVRQIAQRAQTSNLHLSAYLDWEWWSQRRDAALENEEHIVGFQASGVRDLAQAPIPASKLLAIGAPGAIADLKVEINANQPRLAASLSKAEYCEILPRGSSKASGLQAVCAALNYTRQEVVAFGDGDNDLDMLRFAGIAVAMGNAIDSVKAAAHFVTRSHTQDGIAIALEQLGLS